MAARSSLHHAPVPPRPDRLDPTALTEAEYLAAYDPRRYPPVAVTADVAVLTIRQGRLSVLLVQRAAHPFRGAWALPGGFVEPGEDLDDAARRELAQEAGLADFPGHLEQLRTFGAPDRDPRMRVVSVAYLGLVPDLPAPTAGSDAAAAHFWAAEDLGRPDGPHLAFDHADILDAAVERARAKLEYTSLATAFVPEPFSIPDLRRVYEAVWGGTLDASNFRRKVLATPGLVTPVGEVARGPEGGRPAPLYRRGDAEALHPPMLRPDALGLASRPSCGAADLGGPAPAALRRPAKGWSS